MPRGGDSAIATDFDVLQQRFETHDLRNASIQVVRTRAGPLHRSTVGFTSQIRRVVVSAYLAILRDHTTARCPSPVGLHGRTAN